MQALISKMIETARSMTVVPPRDVILATQATKLGSMDPEAYGALAHSLAEFGSVLDRLSEVTCPSTVLVGELDQPFREPSVVMSGAIPGSRLVVIAGAGHCPQKDQLEVWLGEVEQHLVWAAEP